MADKIIISNGLSDRELMLATLVWRLSRALPQQHAARICATEHLQKLGFGIESDVRAATSSLASVTADEVTDEMIDAACAAVSDLYRVDAVRAIEAALSAAAKEDQCVANALNWGFSPEGIAWAEQAAAEQAEQFRREAEDAEQVRKAMKGWKRCDNCSGTGFDAEPDGFGGAIGGTCEECNGGGFVKEHQRG